MAESIKKSLFVDFVQSTTLHGIRNVFLGGSKRRRFIWFIFVVMSILAFIWSFLNLLTSYVTKEVVTRISVKSEDVAKFPAVTLCNFNPVRMSYVRHLNLSDHGIVAKYVLAANAFNITHEDYSKISKSNMSEFLRASGHKIEDMLLNCKLQEKRCYASDFEQVETNMGFCYTFNFGRYTS